MRSKQREGRNQTANELETRGSFLLEEGRRNPRNEVDGFKAAGNGPDIVSLEFRRLGTWDRIRIQSGSGSNPSWWSDLLIMTPPGHSLECYFNISLFQYFGSLTCEPKKVPCSRWDESTLIHCGPHLKSKSLSTCVYVFQFWLGWACKTN